MAKNGCTSSYMVATRGCWLSAKEISRRNFFAMGVTHWWQVINTKSIHFFHAWKFDNPSSLFPSLQNEVIWCEYWDIEDNIILTCQNIDMLDDGIFFMLPNILMIPRVLQIYPWMMTLRMIGTIVSSNYFKCEWWCFQECRRCFQELDAYVMLLKWWLL